MKTISFFSEKGGVGKSSFTILYASWLYDKLGLKVAVADFDDRIQAYRDSEINERNKLVKQRLKDIQNNPNLGEIPPLDVNKAWPIYGPSNREISEIERINRVVPYTAWFRKTFLDGFDRNGDPLKDYDVILLDFPGTLKGGIFEQIYGMNLVSQVVVPVEKDQMTLTATIRLDQLLHNFRKDNYCFFLTKAQLGLSNLRTNYIKFAKRLTEEGFKMLPDMIIYSDRMTTLEKVDITRSTFYYPDYENNVAFKDLSDLGVENLFIDVTRELQKKKDIPGTGRVDLSAIDDFKKKNDGKNFTGSAFPEYEL